MLTVKDGFLVCPTCRRNRHLLRISPDTTAENLVVFCRDCKTEHHVNIRRGQCFESRSQ
nr:MAG TPA_asm: cysteine-rich protein [Caudoviricetes sp.]